MANELSLSALVISFAKSGSPTLAATTVPTITPDIAGAHWMHNAQEIGTSEEAILLGDIGAGGYVYIRNLSANFISFRVATGQANFARLNTGEWMVMRWGSGATAPYAIADTAAVNIEIIQFDA